MRYSSYCLKCDGLKEFFGSCQEHGSCLDCTTWTDFVRSLAPSQLSRRPSSQPSQPSYGPSSIQVAKYLVNYLPNNLASHQVNPPHNYLINRLPNLHRNHHLRPASTQVANHLVQHQHCMFGLPHLWHFSHFLSRISTLLSTDNY